MNDYFDYLEHLGLEELRKEFKQAIESCNSDEFIRRRVIPRILKLIALRKSVMPKYNKSGRSLGFNSAQYESQTYSLYSGDNSTVNNI